MIENVKDWKPGQIVLFNDTDHQQAAIEALKDIEFHEDEVNWRDGVDQLGGSAQFISLREESAGELIAAAEPHLRRKWAEELLGEGVLGAGYSVLMSPKRGDHPVTTFTRAVKHMLALLEGNGE